MIEVQSMSSDDMTKFRERAARGAGYVYYRDETDYKFGSNEPVIPKHKRIDLTPAIIRMAQNTFINYGSLNYSTDDINNGKRIILQQDMTEIERFDRIYRQENWAREILEIALVKARAGEMNPDGDMALQQLAFTEGRSLLDNHGREIEKRIDFNFIYNQLMTGGFNNLDASILSERAERQVGGQHSSINKLNIKKSAFSHIYANRYMAESKSEIISMMKADAYRFLKSDFKPLLKWNPYGRANYRTYLTWAVRNGIRSQIELDSKLESPTATARRKWGYKGITAVNTGKTPIASDLVLMSLRGSLNWRYVDTWRKSEMLSRYIVEKRFKDIDPVEVSKIIGMRVDRKILMTVLNVFSTWIRPAWEQYLYPLAPPGVNAEGIPFEDIRFQTTDRDEGAAARTKYLIPFEEANDLIEKYCTEISKGKATKEQIIKVADYCIEDLKDNRGRIGLHKHEKIAKILNIKIETYNYRKRGMHRSGFFKNYNYEFGK